MKKYLFFLILFISSTVCSQDTNNIYSFEYNGVKYDIVKENKKWVEAAYYADLMGGILAEVNTQQEQDTIFYHLNNAGIDPNDNVAPDGGSASYIWIGGNDFAEEGKWIWDGSNAGIGDQFWQGTKTGNPVGDMYNNWGNEPDNFGNQDALGLAITNWLFGKAGQWNDISADNKLYFVIEYDNSTIPIKGVKYSYDKESIVLSANLSFDYDSLHILVNDERHATLFNIIKTDSTFESNYEFSESSIITARLIAFRNDKKSVSHSRKLELFKIVNPVSNYSTYFEDTPSEDFMGDDFSIKKEFGFSTKAVHSIHDYNINTDYTFTLLRPIIVSRIDNFISYSDVAIVEPGEVGSIFGSDTFNDYVIVEGSRVLGEWIPISDGYDANLFPDWRDAWDSGAQYKKLYRNHTFDLPGSILIGDTILVRFRMHSNEQIIGWGWTIDSLFIQSEPTNIQMTNIAPNTFELLQNYPNPFNPATTISYSIADQVNVSLIVYDVLGGRVATLVNKIQKPGSYKIQWDASSLPSGVYFYKLTSGNYSNAKRMILLK